MKLRENYGKKYRITDKKSRLGKLFPNLDFFYDFLNKN